MKVIHKEPKTVILRFDSGEKVIKGLSAYCTDNKITAGHFTGLGACQSIILSYYDLENKQYLDEAFSEDMEIVSLTGNVAIMAKKPAIHCHGIFADDNYQTSGGHVKELLVSATCEIHLTILDGILERSYDQKTGLNLLQ